MKSKEPSVGQAFLTNGTFDVGEVQGDLSVVELGYDFVEHLGAGGVDIVDA
mgnify:CR=1 FL=1